MDRQLKERMIGAIVIVSLGVLIIPEFLSGPDQTSTVSVDLDLPAASDPDTKSYSFRLDQLAPTPSAPMPAPTVAEQETPAGAVDAVPASPPSPEPDVDVTPELEVEPAPNSLAASAAPAPDESAPVPPAEAEAWVVQLGSFSSVDNARRLAAQLELRGYAPFVTEFSTGGQTLHRVRVGPAGTRDQAEALASRLKAQGQNTKVVPQT